MEDIKFKAKRIDNGIWVSGHYFVSPLTDENSGTSPDKGWFFLSDGIKRHCIERDGVVFVVDSETIKRDFGVEDEGRFYGPFTFPEFYNRIEAITNYLSDLTADEYNRLPLSMRQALEFLYDCMKVEVSDTAKQDAEHKSEELANNGI